MKFLFSSDLHGSQARYNKLFHEVEIQNPDAVLLGGDLLPHYRMADYEEFINQVIFNGILSCNRKNGNKTAFFVILGNDDPRSAEEMLIDGHQKEILFYINQKKINYRGCNIYGYSFVPPTPFLMKDWEKYDVSRFADPGCVHPTEGFRTVEPDYDTEYSTIADDIQKMILNDNLSNALFLFHSPPYQTSLDRAALDGKFVDYVPLDIHVGSIAIKRFIEEKSPLITLHGHIHESTSLTGKWMEKLGDTYMFNGATHTPELALIAIDTENPDLAKRILI